MHPLPLRIGSTWGAGATDWGGSFGEEPPYRTSQKQETA